MPKRLIIKSVIFSACLCFFSILPAYAGATICINADKMYAFALKCYADADYSTAVVELKRFIFYFPKDKRIPKAHYSIGMAYFKGHNYGKAESSFQSIAQQYAGQNIAIESVFMVSRCYLELNDTSSAIDILRRLAAETGRAQIRDRAYDRLGWIYLENGELESARQSFESISGSNRTTYHVKAILAQLDRSRKRLPYKNPVLAGLMSVIPGGGYFYCGRYQDAMIAFILNTGLGVAAYESYNKDLYALGGMISIVNLGFYSGSIYGGITSAYKYNDRAYNTFIRRLRDSIQRTDDQPGPDLSLGVRHKGICLSFNYRF